jgi:hypothetical protein
MGGRGGDGGSGPAGTEGDCVTVASRASERGFWGSVERGRGGDRAARHSLSCVPPIERPPRSARRARPLSCTPNRSPPSVSEWGRAEAEHSPRFAARRPPPACRRRRRRAPGPLPARGAPRSVESVRLQTRGVESAARRGAPRQAHAAPAAPRGGPRPTPPTPTPRPVSHSTPSPWRAPCSSLPRFCWSRARRRRV